jgi:hypothetical protein
VYEKVRVSACAPLLYKLRVFAQWQIFQGIASRHRGKKLARKVRGDAALARRKFIIRQFLATRAYHGWEFGVAFGGHPLRHSAHFVSTYWVLNKPDYLRTWLKSDCTPASREIVAMRNQRVEFGNEEALQSICFLGDVRLRYKLHRKGIKAVKSNGPVELRAFPLSLEMGAETAR